MIVAIFLMLAPPAQHSNLGNQMVAARNKWQTCTAQNARKYALSTKEPAASVVEAAIGECSEDFRAVQTSVMAVFGPAETEETLKLLLDNWRPQLTAGVFRLRSAPRSR